MEAPKRGLPKFYKSIVSNMKESDWWLRIVPSIVILVTRNVIFTKVFPVLNFDKH